MFTNAAVAKGITIGRSGCAVLERQETAVWVEVEGKGACLRYYAAGLTRGGPNPVAAGWFHGDILGTKPTSIGHQEGLGVTAMIGQSNRLAERHAVPFVFFGRPGSYGSAGLAWTTRHRPIEAALMNAALDAVKARYRIAHWALGGHSAGGQLVAEFLARRDDVRCAVLSSGPVAYRAYLQARRLTHLLASPERWYDPYDSVGKIPADPERRVFVIGDPRETNVPFETQALYAKALKAHGHAAWLVPLERAPAPRFHNLVDFGGSRDRRLRSWPDHRRYSGNARRHAGAVRPDQQLNPDRRRNGGLGSNPVQDGASVAA
ncbi:alpha/beta hydrolase family protein [Azospirillum doebereinerae]|uniref:alpha/beta hydrolase family protein n=1 Tax=Azospirillum doebereinerae TaxID=92933 RepID=UPI00384F1C1D